MKQPHIPGPRVELAGQMELPQTGPDISSLAGRRAAAPMRATKAQKACDHGLFSDGGAQLNLVDLTRNNGG